MRTCFRMKQKYVVDNLLFHYVVTHALIRWFGHVMLEIEINDCCENN